MLVRQLSLTTTSPGSRSLLHICLSLAGPWKRQPWLRLSLRRGDGLGGGVRGLCWWGISRWQQSALSTLVLCPCMLLLLYPSPGLPVVPAGHFCHGTHFVSQAKPFSFPPSAHFQPCLVPTAYLKHTQLATLAG